MNPIQLGYLSVIIFEQLQTGWSQDKWALIFSPACLPLALQHFLKKILPKINFSSWYKWGLFCIKSCNSLSLTLSLLIMTKLCISANIMDLNEKLSKSVFHPDPSCIVWLSANNFTKRWGSVLSSSRSKQKNYLQWKSDKGSLRCTFCTAGKEGGNLNIIKHKWVTFDSCPKYNGTDRWQMWGD